MKQLESGFKRTINWNKYKFKVTQQTRNRHSDFLRVSRLFASSFEDRGVRESYKYYFLSTVETKDYNAVVDGRNFLDQPVRNNSRIYYNIRKIAIGQGDDYTTGCLIDYPYFKNYYKPLAIDLSKQKKINAFRKAMQLINFSGNLYRGGITQMFFIVEEEKETVCHFSKRTLKVL